MSYLRPYRFQEVEYFELVYSPFGLFPKKPVFCFLLDGLLIDSGQSKMRGYFRDLVAEKNIEKAFITHFHEDHVGNVPVLDDSNIPTFANPITAKLVRHPEKLPFIERFVWGTADPCEVQPLSGSISTNNFELEILHTPGHSADHTCLYERSRGWLFSADLYVSRRIKFFMSGERIEEQIESIRNLLELDFDVLFCSHNPQLSNGKQLMQEKLQYLEDFYGKVAKLYHEGLNKRAIMHRMRIKENRMLKYLSGGRLSARNMVSSVVRCEQNLLFQSILTENLLEVPPTS